MKNETCCRCNIVIALSLGQTDSQLSSLGSVLVSPSEPSLEWKGVGSHPVLSTICLLQAATKWPANLQLQNLNFLGG
jgi:hypothetical protein